MLPFEAFFFYKNLLFRKVFFRVRIFMLCYQLVRYLQSCGDRREASCVLHIHARFKGRFRERTIAFHLNNYLTSLKLCVHPPLILSLVVEATGE